MADKNYRVLFNPPYQSNDVDGSRSDQVQFTLSNLSEYSGGSVTFSMTGAATSNTILYLGDVPILYGSYFNPTVPKTSNTMIFQPQESDTFVLKYQTLTSSLSVGSRTATVSIVSAASSFALSVSSYIFNLTMSVSSSLSASTTTGGKYDVSDGNLNWDSTNSTGIYTKSAIPLSALTANPILYFNNRTIFSSGADPSIYRLRGLSFINSGTEGRLQLNITLFDNASSPIKYYIINNVSTNIKGDRGGNRGEIVNEYTASLSAGETAFMRIAFGQNDKSFQYRNSQPIAAYLNIEHNALNLPSPIRINLANEATTV